MAFTNNLKKDQLNDVYREIAEVLDVESAIILHDLFKGLQITFPNKLLQKEYIIKEIMSNYDGTNIKELSKKYGYSERWVRQLLKQEKVVNK